MAALTRLVDFISNSVGFLVYLESYTLCESWFPHGHVARPMEKPAH